MFSFPWIADRPEEAAGDIPGHDLGGVIGTGGMGEIRRARQISLGRDVAVKIIVEHRRTPQDRDRFLREARVLAQLDHPNIVPIYDYGIDAEDRCYYTMKLVRGRTLKDIMIALSKGLESWTIERRLEVFGPNSSVSSIGMAAVACPARRSGLSPGTPPPESESQRSAVRRH